MDHSIMAVDGASLATFTNLKRYTNNDDIIQLTVATKRQLSQQWESVNT